MVSKVVIDSDASADNICTLIHQFSEVEKLKTAKRIGIKPNLTVGQKYDSSSGVVSNKQILIHLIQAVQRINPTARICILESDNMDGGVTAEKYAYQGYHELEDMGNVKLINLSTGDTVIQQFNGMYFRSQISIPAVFEEIDFLISLAKMKTHYMTTISGSLKNMFGCIGDPKKDKYHLFINRVITDISRVLRPDLSIVEGFPALIGNGPVMGIPYDAGIIMISNDPVAADSELARIFKFNPGKIQHLKKAIQAGIGSGCYQLVNHGEPVSIEPHFQNNGRAAAVWAALKSRYLFRQGTATLTISQLVSMYRKAEP